MNRYRFPGLILLFFVLALSGGVLTHAVPQGHDSPAINFTVNQVVHDFLHSHGASRHVQYDLLTGELFLVGESGHGLDWFEGSGGFWWCSFGGAHSSAILSFILRESTVENGASPDHYPPGIEPPYNDPSTYNLVRLVPLESQKTWVNQSSGATGFPDDYREFDNSENLLEFFLYQSADGSIHVAVMGEGVDALLDSGNPDEASGDGTGNRDNGVRIDIAFKASVSLERSKRHWLGRLHDGSVSYPTEPMGSF